MTIIYLNIFGFPNGNGTIDCHFSSEEERGSKEICSRLSQESARSLASLLVHRHLHSRCGSGLNWTYRIGQIADDAGIAGPSPRETWSEDEGKLRRGCWDHGGVVPSGIAGMKFSQVFGERAAGEEVQEGMGLVIPFRLILGGVR